MVGPYGFSVTRLSVRDKRALWGLKIVSVQPKYFIAVRVLHVDKGSSLRRVIDVIAAGRNLGSDLWRGARSTDFVDA